MKNATECKCFEGIEKVLKTHLGHLKPVESINCCTECRPYNRCYDKECSCHEAKKEKCTSCYSTTCECSCEACVYPISTYCGLHPRAKGKCVCFQPVVKKIEKLNVARKSGMSFQETDVDMEDKINEIIDFIYSTEK